MYNCPCMVNQSVANLDRWATWTNRTAWPLSWFITGPARCTGVVAVFLMRIIGLLMVVLAVHNPALLRNRSSGYATGHPVKYPDRGWASVWNIYTVWPVSKVHIDHLTSLRSKVTYASIPLDLGISFTWFNLKGCPYCVHWPMRCHICINYCSVVEYKHCNMHATCPVVVPYVLQQLEQVGMIVTPESSYLWRGHMLLSTHPHCQPILVQRQHDSKNVPSASVTIIKFIHVYASYRQVRCRWPWGHNCLPVHTCTCTCCHSPTGQSPHTDQHSLRSLDQHDRLGAPLPPYLRDPLRHPGHPKSSLDLEQLVYQLGRPFWQKVGGVNPRDFPAFACHMRCAWL